MCNKFVIIYISRISIYKIQHLRRTTSLFNCELLQSGIGPFNHDFINSTYLYLLPFSQPDSPQTSTEGQTTSLLSPASPFIERWWKTFTTFSAEHKTKALQGLVPRCGAAHLKYLMELIRQVNYGSCLYCRYLVCLNKPNVTLYGDLEAIIGSLLYVY